MKIDGFASATIQTFFSTIRNLALISVLLGAALQLSGNPFPLTDSGPASPEFKQRFLANYGVNSEVEPTISTAERPLYEKVAPFLREDPERAIQEVESALKDNSSPAFRFLLGSLYYQTGQMEEAERNLKTSIEQFPDFRRAHRTLGLIYIQDGRLQEAVETWLKVITLGGGDAQSYGLLGYAYLSLDKYDSALTAYEKARMFRPDSLDFRRGQAQALLQTGRWERAAALFEELIAEQPDVADYWLLQANAFLRLERHEEAIGNLELAQSLGADTVQSRFLLGDLHLREGNHRLAISQYRRAISETDGWTVAQGLQPLQHLFSQGLIDEARVYLAELRPLLSGNLEREQADQLAVYEIRILAASGETDEAIDKLRQLVERNPIHGEALLLISDLHQEAGDFDQAEFYLTRALSLAKFETDARIALGRMEVARGNLEAALNHLRLARRTDSRPGLDRYIESLERL